MGKSDSNTHEVPGAPVTTRAYHKIARDLAWETSGVDRLIRLEVISRSMYPMLRPGDKVVVQEIQPEALRTGDLVVIRKQDEFITHRLVGRVSNSYITKGDGWRHLDPPVLEDSILGAVVIIKRKDKDISLQTKYWRLANLCLGYLNLWEGLFFGILRAFKSRLKGLS